MANETMTLISTITVGSGSTSSIDFTSIPQTYTDLVMQVSARDNAAGAGWSDMIASINGSTPTVSRKWLSQSGSGGDSIRTFSYGVHGGNTTNTFGNSMTYIPNYAGSSVKTWFIDGSAENNASGNALLNMQATVLTGFTSAITSITLTNYDSATFAQYSTFSLYGILKGSGGATVS